MSTMHVLIPQKPSYAQELHQVTHRQRNVKFGCLLALQNLRYMDNLPLYLPQMAFVYQPLY